LSSPWYKINNIETIDTPALVIYADRVKYNIQLLIDEINDINRLRPHVKTHKTKEVTLMMLKAGISKFKCATIAEAEMLALCGCKDVLLAYQPSGPKLQRFFALQQKYLGTTFSCLIDNILTVQEIDQLANQNHLIISVYIDLNVGMHRTGIEPNEEALKLAELAASLQNVKLLGLHAYDGQTQDLAIAERTLVCHQIYDNVNNLKQLLEDKGISGLTLIMGGSPSFPIYAKLANLECSPGTFIFWDQSYIEKLPEQNFKPAALVLGRLVSMPSKDRICLDIGHKAVGAENGLTDRIKFLNAPHLTVIGHSEEHLVLKVNKDHSYKIGDLFYGLPFHVCPTCALYETATIIENGNANIQWEIVARKRMISV
jgi:D-serine deaminase-like pyridoxal phosphate-dependent protein